MSNRRDWLPLIKKKLEAEHGWTITNVVLLDDVTWQWAGVVTYQAIGEQVSRCFIAFGGETHFVEHRALMSLVAWVARSKLP